MEFPISKDIVVATPDDIERLRDVVGTIFYDVVPGRKDSV